MTVISSATKRNFEKLNKDIDAHEFTARANKRDSKKNIIPTEYYTNKNNIEKISAVVDAVRSLDKTVAFDTLILLYLKGKGILDFEKGRPVSAYPYVENFISTLQFEKDLSGLSIPGDEQDPLGLIYQQLITEGEKNKKGSYYTPQHIVAELMEMEPDAGQTFCDPCCGTGGFLLKAVDKFSPKNVYGYDLDPMAVKIAKANLFSKHPEVDYNSRILCGNFLLEKSRNYDYFITNPPWGSLTEKTTMPPETCIKSGESFSYFLEAALKSMSQNGVVDFLLPVSILNVKVHKDIRDFILENYRIDSIKVYGKCFKGVMTDVISIKIKRERNSTKNWESSANYKYTVKNADGKTFSCPISSVLWDKNHNIFLLDELDSSIIRKIEQKGTCNLKNAKFALGIVTGDNKKLLKQTESPELRPIITGKDVKKYVTEPPSRFIRYDRASFQQVCPDSFFQTESKFLYRFISKKLVFALDENKYLSLNSANIMVLPDCFELDKYVVLALLNSDLLNFYFIRKINQIKVLKDDLQNLPLPSLDEKSQKKIIALVKNAIASKASLASAVYDSVENYLYDLYGMNEKEIKRIKEVVYK